MTRIIVTKPGTLTAADKKALRAAGVIPVEAAEPGDVRLVQTEGPSIGPDEMLYCAVSALAMQSGNITEARAIFTDKLMKALAMAISSRATEASKP